MKIFKVLCRKYDLADSYEDTLVGYFEAESAQDVRCYVGPNGVFSRFIVTEIEVVKIPGAESV